MLSQEAAQAATEGWDLGAWARLILKLPGTPPGLRGLDRWVRWSLRLNNGKEMPLRLRLIEFGADVVAGGRSSGDGGAGSGCLGGLILELSGAPPGLRGLERWARWSHRL